MLIRLILYQIFISTSTLSFDIIELKHYYYLHGDAMVVDYGAGGHKNFSMFPSLTVDLLSEFFVESVYFQFENRYGTENDIVVYCKGTSPHSTHTEQCGKNDIVDNTMLFSCDCSTRFITVAVTRPFEVGYIDITGLELFSVLYAGCYESSLDGGYLVDELSECIFDCFRRGHNLAGVKNRYCFCFDKFAGVTVEYNLCNVRCLGLQICGSERHIMLYFTDYHSFIDRRKTLTTTECIKVANRCDNCYNGESGINCDLKDCGSENGLCGLMLCHQFEDDPLKGGSCQFRPGLELINRTTFLDVDECEMGIIKCGENENCVNTFGAFTCLCGFGYNNDENGCRDIDECLDGTSICDENMYCTNSLGSYFCECIEGFHEKDNGCVETITDSHNISALRNRWTTGNIMNSYTAFLSLSTIVSTFFMIFYKVCRRGIREVSISS